VSRSRLYYKPVGEKPENIKIMQMMDKHLAYHPAEGVRSMVDMLGQEGITVNPKRIRRLFGVMGYRAVYRRKNLSRLGFAEFIRPYLLRHLEITRPNQVWCTDITFIPMKQGFLYLTAIMDIYSRKILSWGISNSLEASWCVDVFHDAVAQHGLPEIINTDQGSQYTSAIWTKTLDKMGVTISMDGKGRATDNIWIERFWKTIKYNYLNFHPAENGTELYKHVDYYVNYYNNKKHQTLGTSPNQAYERFLTKSLAS
jgi:putative transposase